MKCSSCSDEYPEPDIIDNVAYFVCSSCGHLHEVKNYQALTGVSEIIDNACHGTTSAAGLAVGLL